MSASDLTAKWEWLHFDELSAADLYKVIKARLSVFAVEQQCWYQDADDLDLQTWHLLGWNSNRSEVLAYLRLLPPGAVYAEPGLGRILTTERARGKGLSQELMELGIKKIEELYPGKDIRIGAQQRLEEFYRRFGFETVSEPYEEDRILHVHMLRTGR